MRTVRFIIILLLMAGGRWPAAMGQCDTLALPVSEDFDSYGSGVMPPCWCASCNYDLGGMPGIASAPGNAGGNALYLYSGSITGSHYSIVITTVIDSFSTDSLFVKFRFYASSTATRLEMGLCDDTGRYTRHFTPLDTLHVNQGSRWQEMVVAVGRQQLDSSGRRLAFRLQRTLQVENCECYIDDLRIENCGVTLPEASHVSSTSLTLHWERYGEGVVGCEWSSEAGAGGSLDSVVPPLTLTGLEPATTYTVGLGCQGGTLQQLTVTTLEGAGLFPAYYEPFDGSSLPSGWFAPLDSRPQVAGGCLTMQPTGDDSCLAVLPLHDLPSSNELKMSLSVRSSGVSTLVAGVMDYAGEAESFTAMDTLALGTQTAAFSVWTVDFGGYDGEGRYLALMAKGSGTVYIDHLRVARCLVDSVRLFNLTDTSVTVGWDTLSLESGAAVTLEYGPMGFAPGTGTTVAAGTNPFILMGLTASTSYDLLVDPTCGDSICAYDRHPFSTFDHEIVLPYCTGFETLELPQGWVCSRGTAQSAAAAYAGNHGLKMTSATVTMPKVTVGVNDTLLVDFYGLGSSTIETGYMADPYGTFIASDTLAGTGSWSHFVTPLALPTGHLPALRCSGTWYIDGMALHRDAVDTATVSRIEQTSAHLAWTLLHGDSVRVEYAAVASPIDDFEGGTGIRFAALDSLTLDSLQPAIWYALHLQPLSDSA
jgi:hypothetical protein